MRSPSEAVIWVPMDQSLLFSRTGLKVAPGADEEAVMDVALEAGADDIVAADDGSLDVITPWEAMAEIRDALVGRALSTCTQRSRCYPALRCYWIPLRLQVSWA